jgi:Arc/MetJ family transcription regulator
MRTTLTFDDDIYAKAQELTGITERGALINEALRSLVQREAARRLALLGGTEATLQVPPRKRSVAASTTRARK